MLTYFIQASYGARFQDYYIKAGSYESAQKKAEKLFVKELGIATKFAKTV
jgi:hypothetical protein